MQHIILSIWLIVDESAINGFPVYKEHLLTEMNHAKDPYYRPGITTHTMIGCNVQW